MVFQKLRDRFNKKPTMISVAGSQDNVWSDMPGSKPVSGRRDSPVLPDVITAENTLIVPGVAPTKWEKFRESTLEVLSEYSRRARSMHIPVPEISPPLHDENPVPNIPLADTAPSGMPQSAYMPTAAPLPPVPVQPVPVQPQQPQQVQPAVMPKPTPARKFGHIPLAGTDTETDSYNLVNEIVTTAANEFGNAWRPPAQTRVATPVSEFRMDTHSRQSQPVRATEPPSKKSSEYVGEGFQVFGRIVTADVDEKPSPVTGLISSFFFLVTFLFATVTILAFGTIIALAIALSNAGSPQFIYLKYYPQVGLLPIITCLATLVFLYVSHKIRDGSRYSWVIAVLSLIVLPVSFTYLLPALTYPLVKLVSVYAGSPAKPLIAPSISVRELGQLSSLFLLFEAGVVLLLIFIGSFTKKGRPLSGAAKSSLAVISGLFLIPISTVTAYGYYSANYTDFGYTKATEYVSYHIYTPRDYPGDRVHATNFILNEELADVFNAVKVTYDVPLPTRIQTGEISPITVKQVEVHPKFSLEKFTAALDRSSDALIEPVRIRAAANEIGYVTNKGQLHYLTFVMPDNVLILINSPSGNTEDLIAFADLLE